MQSIFHYAASLSNATNIHYVASLSNATNIHYAASLSNATNIHYAASISDEDFIMLSKIHYAVYYSLIMKPSS